MIGRFITSKSNVIVKRAAITAGFVAAMLWAVATPARASVLIDFATGLGGAGGTITQSGSNVSGSGILVDNMFVNGAPTGDGNNNIDGTAASIGFGGTSGVLDFNTSTGAFSIVGSIPSLGVALQTLLSGTITNFQFSTGSSFTFNASGFDTKSPLLLAALGIPTNTPFAFTGFTIGGIANTDGTFKATSTDISNTSVPEPASLLLLGTGLMFARRRILGKSA